MSDWLNANQGILAAAVLLLTLVGLILGFVFRKRRGTQASAQQIAHVKAGRDVVVGAGDVKIVNVRSPGFSKLEKQVAHMGSELKEALERMQPSQPLEEPEVREESRDLKLVTELVSGESSRDKKEQLKALFYNTSDKQAQLQIALGLANWCFLPENSINDLIDIVDKGIEIANSIEAKSEKAVLLAYKGSFLSYQFDEEDVRTAFTVQASNITGLPLITPEQRQQSIERIQQLDKLSQECFAAAETLAKEAKSYSALALVYCILGSAAGLRYNHLHRFGVPRAEEEKSLSKKALLLAKEIYYAAGDELGAAYALHGLANQLRFFGEKEEAKQLCHAVIQIATKHNQPLLLKKAKGLLKRIESGRIPNYMAGETGDS